MPTEKWATQKDNAGLENIKTFSQKDNAGLENIKTFYTNLIIKEIVFM